MKIISAEVRGGVAYLLAEDADGNRSFKMVGANDTGWFFSVNERLLWGIAAHPGHLVKSGDVRAHLEKVSPGYFHTYVAHSHPCSHEIVARHDTVGTSAQLATPEEERRRAPKNGVGATERDWNEWKAATEAWQAANPEPRHMPYEVCDCEGIPMRHGRLEHGHCAARAPIVAWKAVE